MKQRQRGVLKKTKLPNTAKGKKEIFQMGKFIQKE